jgi:hypothetical protein
MTKQAVEKHKQGVLNLEDELRDAGVTLLGE